MFAQIDKIITAIDNAVWGLPLICLIMATGIFLTARLGLVQIRHLGKAFKFMFKDEEDGSGEVTSFGALCTALSATIGTGNIRVVATAIALGGPGALFWMVIAAFFGMATKYAEGLLAIKYRTIDEDGHVLGGPFYYIENGMGKKWTWLALIKAYFYTPFGVPCEHPLPLPLGEVAERSECPKGRSTREYILPLPLGEVAERSEDGEGKQ